MPTPDIVATRAELRSRGMTRRSIRRAIADGELIRAHRDCYLPGDTAEEVVQAVRVGGLLTCLSVLRRMGVFVATPPAAVHVHIDRGSSRLRSADIRDGPLQERAKRRETLHWGSLSRPDSAANGCVGPTDALIHAVLCQGPRYAIATLDSALHLGVIDHRELEAIVAALPARKRVLCALVDGRAEAGPETLVRLIAILLGCRVEPQVEFELPHGTARVDLVIDEWLIVECDSKEFHSGWAQQSKDRNRDAALAALGYATLRLTAAMILYQHDAVVDALRGLVHSRRSGEGRARRA